MAYAQQSTAKKDSIIVKTPLTKPVSRNNQLLQGVLDADPPNLVRTVEYNAATNQYILYERVGGYLYRPPRYLTFLEYLQLIEKQNQRNYFKQLADNYAYQSQQEGFIPVIKTRSRTFEQIFGSSNITIRPQGSAEVITSGQINSNQNPLLSSRQRTQFNFNLDQHIQTNITGSIGDKLKITANYNSQSQFQFDNQLKLDYTGTPDEIIQKIEVGTVSFPLNSTLITGTQALFGVKTKLKFGKLNVTSVLSQQRSQSKTLTISQQGQQNNFSFKAPDYEANKHYFLAQYFRNNYDRAMANIPIISSNVQITRIEVWVTNRTNNTKGSRDVLAFMDLGENKPYNTSLIQGGAGYSGLPAGFKGPGFAQQSNSLLQNLPAAARQTSSNAIINYFQSAGGNDNYAKLTYARRLKRDTDFTLQPQLGYISLNTALNNDEVLAVAYQYSVNGVQYQVGEFSTDIPVNATTPNTLYVKLLKNALLKTNLPTWNLMMKNIYSLGAFQISPTNFKLSISRLDEKSGIAKPIMDEGIRTKSKLWVQLAGLDNLDAQNNKRPDGYFDFLEGITIDSKNGLITFPVLEPFGSDLAKQFDPSETDLIARYAYQPIYDSTKTIAQQYFPQLNRYVISGTYNSSGGSTYQLNATNIPQGSVIVNAGAIKLVEGTDYTVDYISGTIRIINQGILASGQSITVNLENNELFGVQQKSLFGSRFDYQVNDKLALGGTIMHLTEQPISQNEPIGQESISNTIYGFDINYKSDSRFLTRLVNKIPFITTKVPSSVAFSGEFAQLLPGAPSALSFAGSKNGTAYLDDFESSQSVIDLKNFSSWQISGTPQLFPESKLVNDLSYGYNRARLAFYTIDPVFYTGTLPVSRTELSKPYVREVSQVEIFPFKQSVTGQQADQPTFDLAFYPTIRGPYNYTTTGLNTDGTLANPQNRWGGIFRSISTTDFSSLNVQYIDIWVMDPFIGKPNAQGGDLYLNLGNISEDILLDGRKSLENGLPVNGDNTQVDNTVWGRVAKQQPVVNAFDNNPNNRALQDVGLDGLNDADERTKFATVVQQVQNQIGADAANNFANDPSSDDYQYYQGPLLDKANAGILQRYSRYNGADGNSKTSEQSQAALGISTSASTSLPDGEDVDKDNNMNQDDEYFEYKVSIRPQDLVVGKNYVNDKVTSQVTLANGQKQTVTWYQFRIPISAPTASYGGIQDFKSIRFMRMYMTHFVDTAVLRFATLQLVRGEWRTFNAENNPINVIADPSIVNPPLDNSTINVGTVNIEENGNRNPIPYVVPPGIQRQPNYNNVQTNTKLNEQSLSLTFANVQDGYSRAAFKTFNNDLRKYKRLQMFIHAEGSQLRDNEVSAFVRLGVDYIDNYYEYEIPMKVTQSATNDPNAIWPAANELDLQLSLLVNAKLARNNAKLNGQPWPLNVPFTLADGHNKITIKGQPDLSRLAAVMVGVRNPLKTNSSTNTDDGLAKSGILWFDELRLTDFDNRGGWAATGRFDAKLADFATLTLSGNKTTVGFGALDSRLNDRSLNDTKAYDISGNVELGKFFPDKSGIHIPLYVNVSHQVTTPLYDPTSPDVTLKQALNNATSTKQRDSIQNTAETYTVRKSINLTNVHKTKTNPTTPSRLWDIENFNTTFSYTELNHHDFTTLSDLEKTYHASLDYNFNLQPKYFSPFEKIIKNNLLAIIRDININLIPSRLNYSINFDRFYSENTLRNNDPTNIIPIPTTYNKNFNIRTVYGLGWSLTKSLTLDIDAINLATVDEPTGRVNGLKRDTLWENILKLGRTTNYNHTLTFNYNVPVSKLPFLDWTTVTARYSTHFTWQSQALFGIQNPALNVGNSISNNREIQLNPTFNFTTLYNKFAFIRKANSKSDNKDDAQTSSFTKVLIGLLTSVKNASIAYTRTEGAFLPGYIPQSNFLGEDVNYNAPGIGFLLGSQADIRQKAVANGWLTTDTLQNQQYITSLKEDLHIKASLEPFKDLKIDLIAFKNQDHSYQSNFKFLPSSNSFQNLSPTITGGYTISYLSIATAFSKVNSDNSSSVFNKFLSNRAIISQRLGLQNPNSVGQTTGGYADGYGAGSQNVVVPAFLAAYSGKNANTSNLSAFPNIPIPNWDIRYTGLNHIPFFAELFESVDIRDGYRSTYTVGSYASLLQYQETNGHVSSRDANNDFLPNYQFTSVTIFEQFVPLFGIDVRFKNNITANLEYRKTRALSLSLANSQLAQQNENDIVFGFGYKAKNFRLLGSRLNNDLTFKVDFSIRDNRTLIYQADVEGSQVSSGAKNITYRPQIDYVINKRFNLSLFYDSNITKPYTSQSFNTAFTNFGINLKLLLQ